MLIPVLLYEEVARKNESTHDRSMILHDLRSVVSIGKKLMYMYEYS